MRGKAIRGRMTVWQRWLAAVLLLTCLSIPRSGAAQAGDLTTRLERLSASGNVSGARTLVDSVLAAATVGSEAFVEAMYWHAVLDTTAAGAEHYYLRVAVEYPLSPRASAALLRLAELELARQAKDRARRHLNRLMRDYAASEQIARARYLAARLALDDGRPAEACTLLNAARESVAGTDVELQNQISYLQSSCSVPVAQPARDSAVRDTLVRRPSATPSGPAFSIQIAAYNTQREATALMRQLQRQGHAARVFGTRAPFRVRVGRYPDREAARRAMTQADLRGIIVEAESP
jgi:cell division septation protein DedD